MGPLQEIGTLIIQTLGLLYLLAVVLRFLLQLARADFYNPMSQFVVKATNPVLIPLRRAIPALMGIDLASLILALLVQLLAIELTALLFGGFLLAPQILAWAVLGIISLIVNIYFWGLIIIVICSWVAPHSMHPALVLVRQLVEPITEPVRRLLPDLGGIDFSPILVFLGLQIVKILIGYAASNVGLVGGAKNLVLGI